MGKGGADYGNRNPNESYERSENKGDARVVHSEENKDPVYGDEKNGIAKGKGGNGFEVLCVFEAEGIIVFDIFRNLPAEEKRNKTGNCAEPEIDEPWPIAMGKFRTERGDICAIHGNDPSENHQTEDTGADDDGF